MSLVKLLGLDWFQKNRADQARAEEELAAVLQPFIGPAAPVVDHILGLDLGQSADPSALALVEKMAPPDGSPALYRVRHLHRWPLGTPYPAIVEDMTALVKRPPLDNPRLAIDKTGCGAAVADLFREAEIAAEFRPILITGGSACKFDKGTWHVAKNELVSVVVALFGTGRLRIDADLPLAKTLVAELKNFKVKVTAAGNETMSAWREKEHDDLVLAVAMACWLAERTARGRFEFN